MGEQKANQLKVSYDKEADVLYMSEGEPKKAICQMLDDGVIIRKDPENHRIVGFTIVDFIAHFSRAKPQNIPIGARFSLLQPA